MRRNGVHLTRWSSQSHIDSGPARLLRCPLVSVVPDVRTRWDLTRPGNRKKKPSSLPVLLLAPSAIPLPSVGGESGSRRGIVHARSSQLVAFVRPRVARARLRRGDHHRPLAPLAWAVVAPPGGAGGARAASRTQAHPHRNGGCRSRPSAACAAGSGGAAVHRSDGEVPVPRLAR